MEERIRLAVWNMACLTGVRGGVAYAVMPTRFLFGTPVSVKKNIIATLERLVHEEKPDIVFLMEMYGDPDLCAAMKDYEFFSIDSKYMGQGLLSRLPILRRKDCSGFFARKKYGYRIHGLGRGTKKLLYIIELRPDLSLILGHFALTRRARKEQFAEISRLCEGKKIIVSGDFNVFRGTAELEALMGSRELKVAEAGATFPTSNPYYALDMALVPRDYKVTARVKRDLQASDHLPFVCDITIPA